MRNVLNLIFCSSLFYSCDFTTDCAGFDLGNEFEIALDETLQNCPNNISITLQAIQDSRCPTGGVCIWEGMIVMEATLQIDNHSHEIQLSTNERVSGSPFQIAIEGYTVKLIDAIPFPDVNDTSKPKNKQAILIISKRSS